MIAAAGLVARHVLTGWDGAPGYARWVLGAWMTGMLLVAAQWAVSWFDRPARPTARQERYLAGLRVVVALPVYNENPVILDRTLWSIACQSRPVQKIYVVDDGSSEDYTILREHWSRQPGLTWIRQPNAGKKHAQAAAFRDPDADITVTVDSDSTLDRDAIRNGLAPFADLRVQSVAGVELAYNSRAGWLTRSVDARSRVFQVVTCGAQSVFGDVLVNRGPLAFYRASLVRETLPAYLGETFLGYPVKLGDDAALTLFARGRGRAVQQSNAFTFSMFPETLSHHLRQWTRWMRGSTIRNCWRIRYLPVISFGWWFTLLSTWLFVMSTLTAVVIAVDWPRSAGVLAWITGAAVPWALLSGSRMLAIRRSDETWAHRLALLAYYPSACVWLLLVLRWARWWGILTFLRQGWNTRQGGAEDLTSSLRAQARPFRNPPERGVSRAGGIPVVHGWEEVNILERS